MVDGKKVVGWGRLDASRVEASSPGSVEVEVAADNRL